MSVKHCTGSENTEVPKANIHTMEGCQGDNSANSESSHWAKLKEFDQKKHK